MSGDLTQRQRAALDAYEDLMAQRPELFRGRRARPIVRERAEWERYVARTGELIGVAARTRYTIFVIDLVASRTGAGVRLHPYERLVSPAQLQGGTNVVVLGTIENPALGTVGDIVLVEQERHALGSNEVELPRGFGEPALSGPENALGELADETGYAGDNAYLLGRTVTNSGHTDSLVSYYHVPVVRRAEPRAEVGEAINGVTLWSRDDLREGIRTGAIRDGFTVQALGLWSLHQ